MRVEPMQDLWTKDCTEDIESKVPDGKSRGCGLHDTKSRRCKYPRGALLSTFKGLKLDNLLEVDSQLSEKEQSLLCRNKTHKDRSWGGHYSAQYTLLSFNLPSHQHWARNELGPGEAGGAGGLHCLDSRGLHAGSRGGPSGTSRLFDDITLLVPVELSLPIPHGQRGFGSRWDGI